MKLSKGGGNPQLTIALPAFNEEANIVHVLEESIAALYGVVDSWEIIVIDNHSSDTTTSIVSRFIAEHEYDIRLIVHEENKYYSGSCTTAIREARGEYLAIMDSDGQFIASDLPVFLEKLREGYNLVFGWRIERHDPLFRLIVSWVFNQLGRWKIRFPFHDLNVGFRVLDRQAISVVKIAHKINMVNPELYVRAHNAGLKMTEVPIQHRQRRGGITSHQFKALGHIYRDVSNYLSCLSDELKR